MHSVDQVMSRIITPLPHNVCCCILNLNGQMNCLFLIFYCLLSTILFQIWSRTLGSIAICRFLPQRCGSIATTLGSLPRSLHTPCSLLYRMFDVFGVDRRGTSPSSADGAEQRVAERVVTRRMDRVRIRVGRVGGWSPWRWEGALSDQTQPPDGGVDVDVAAPPDVLRALGWRKRETSTRRLTAASLYCRSCFI